MEDWTREFCVLRVIAAGMEHENSLPVEAAALLVRMDAECDRFSCLIDPGCDPPAWLCERSGRKGEEYRRGLPPEEAARELREFLGRRPLMIFERKGSERSLLSEGNLPLLDQSIVEMRHLAWLCLPYLRDHSLETLASALLGENLPWRAREEARLMLRILEKLREAWREVPARIRAAVLGALAESHNPWLPFLSGGRKTFSSTPFPDLIDLLPRLETYSIRESDASDASPVTAEKPPSVDPEEAAEFLSEGGPLASVHPQHEARPQQVAMAREVAGALNDSAFLVVEAGTGVGKSLAYLVPGVLYAQAGGNSLIVSTYTRNLQEQLFHRDLPLLSRALGSFEFALLKGRNNYLCLRKWSEWCASLARGEPALPLGDIGPAEGYAFLASWITRTPCGDLEEISIDLRLSLAGLTDQLASHSEDCLRSRCRFQGRCFVERARARAARSRVVVVNHALLLSQISTAEAEPPDLVLPPYRHLVIDEAHHLEDVATEAFGLSFSLEECLRILEDGTGGKGVSAVWRNFLEDDHSRHALAEYETMAERARSAAEELFMHLLPSALPPTEESILQRDEPDRRRLTRGDLARPAWDEARLKGEELADLLSRYASLTLELKEKAAATKPAGEDQELPLAERRAEVLAERADAGSAALSVFFRHPREEDFSLHIRWVERTRPSASGERGRTPSSRIRCAPVNVADTLAGLLFRRLDAVVLTSASLRAPGGRRGFSFFLHRTGLDLVEEMGREIRLISLDSPFDYAGRSLLLAVKDLPQPAADPGASRHYLREIRRVAEEVIRAVGGRTLVLLTSHQQVGHLYRELKPRLEPHGICCLCQSRGIPNALILERFREDRDSVLLATEAFWEGVDVPGESLSAVIMVKLPFRHPEDPVVAGRVEHLQNRGGNGWRSYYLPLAVTLFRQGIGRLIRRATDRGVVVILDPRFLNRSYSSSFRDSLPTGMRVEVVGKEEVGEAVRRFFREDIGAARKYRVDR